MRSKLKSQQPDPQRFAHTGGAQSAGRSSLCLHTLRGAASLPPHTSLSAAISAPRGFGGGCDAGDGACKAAPEPGPARRHVFGVEAGGESRGQCQDSSVTSHTSPHLKILLSSTDVTALRNAMSLLEQISVRAPTKNIDREIMTEFLESCDYLIPPANADAPPKTPKPRE